MTIEKRFDIPLIEDMKKLLLSTRGKVFALANLDRLIECSRLAEFRTR